LEGLTLENYNSTLLYIFLKGKKDDGLGKRANNIHIYACRLARVKKKRICQEQVRHIYS